MKTALFLLSLALHMALFLLIPETEEKKETEKGSIKVKVLEKRSEKRLQNSSLPAKKADNERAETGFFLEKQPGSQTLPGFFTEVETETEDLLWEESSYSYGIDSHSPGDPEIFLEDDLLIPEEESQEVITVSWENEKRAFRSEPEINFSEFPGGIFSGIDVTVKILVDSNGNVFSADILPPGSGSSEFDRLLRVQVLKFTFEQKPGEEFNHGEIHIVYEN